MFKYTNAFTNRSGDSLPGYFARLYDSGGNLVSIYADASETPISTVSGVANAALSDENGMFRWYVANGTYDIRFYDANDVFVSVETGVPMVDAGALTVDLSDSGGAAMVGNQIPAGANLRTQTLAEFVDGGPLMPSQFAGTDEQQLTRAIVEAATARPTIGQTVMLPRGVIEIAAPFNCANRVSVIGVNKRGTVITPSGSWSGAYMATAVNGTTSMFDNALERLTLDCDHVVGLGGIIADAWQEGGGLRNVLIEKFTTNGVYIRNGYGGASTCLINDCEIMGSATVAADAGIYIEEVSALGNFLVHVTNSTITGGGAGFELDYGIYVENDSLFCDAVHFEDATSAIYLDGVGNHVLTGVTGNNTVTNLVEIASTFTGSLKMTGCFRGGATNLIKDNRAGGFGTISYDTEVSIKSNPPLAHGAIVASASIDGSGTPAVTKGFGIASITDNGTGDYTVTLTRSAQNSADFSVFASMNANGWVQCALNGVDSVRVKCFNGSGGAIDVNELKILVVRVA